MEFLEKLNRQIRNNQTEMQKSLSELISIPSVAVREKGRYPFGEPVQQAFEKMLTMAEDDGFSVFNADNFGGHIDFAGDGDDITGVVGHLDVVPAGDGWDFEPYCGDIKDGYICGRGATDDKGPVIAAYYAMKALKQCGYKPSGTVRLILGLDEETDWYGMKYYLSQVDRTPDRGFTPDADFPVISAEMGILVFDIVKKFPKSRGKGLELSSIKGGNAANSVADYARAVISDSTGAGYDLVKEMVAGARRNNNWKINCRGIGKSLEISVQGVSAHGARPEKGLNAVSVLMEFLGEMNFLNDGVSDFIKFYNECISYNLHGENIGCALEDELSGRLVFNVGMIDLDRDSGKITVNIRYPVTADANQVYDGIMTVLDEYGFGIVKGKHHLPVNVPADSMLLTTLLDVYRKHTGDTESKAIVTGGGTYARSMDNIVAFGARFPGEEEVGHQRNEKISVSSLLKLTDIYAEAIYELSKGTV